MLDLGGGTESSFPELSVECGNAMGKFCNVDLVAYIAVFRCWGWVLGEGVSIAPTQNYCLKFFYVLYPSRCSS